LAHVANAKGGDDPKDSEEDAEPFGVEAFLQEIHGPASHISAFIDHAIFNG
jgi:hypothetical protein